MTPPREASRLPGVGDLPPLHFYVLAVILIHTLGHFAYVGLWTHLTAPDFDVNDFKAYYTSARAVRTGQAEEFLYSDPDRLNLGLLPPQPWVDYAVDAGIPHPSAYIYPPFFAMTLAPLTVLSYHSANLAWFAFNTALLGGSVLLLGRLWRVRRRGPDWLEWGAIVFVSLNFYPTIRAMQCGQTGFILLFLSAAALSFQIGPRDDGRAGIRDMWTGLCLAVAAAIKLTPIVLIVYLAWAGRRRAAAWGAGLFAALTGVAVAVAGWGNHAIYFTRFLPQLSRGAVTYANQSINGFLNRLLTDNSMSVFDFSPEPASVWYLTRGFAVLLLGGAFLAARASGSIASEQEDTRRIALGYGLVVLTSVLVSPISWEHHYMLALIPLALMIFDEATTSRWTGILLLAAAYAAMAVNAFEFVRRTLPRGNRPAMSFVLYGGLLLWGLVAAALRRRSAPA